MGFVHETLSRMDATKIQRGIESGLTYEAIGKTLTPPVTGGCVYKRAIKMGLVQSHPRHGKRAGPYSRNPVEAF